ncbi:MAG: hypothetical protein Q7R73_01015 [bacterium]|nr:hypothetical protein [bacterium]
MFLFSLFTAICFAVVVFAVLFHFAGFDTKASFMISAVWFMAGIPVGCIFGVWLRKRREASY